MAFRKSSTKILPFVFNRQSGNLRLSAFFSTSIVGEQPILVRDFIRSALYDPNYGYFSQRSGSVGVLERAIRFHQLEGRKAYMKHLDRIYKQSDISWFTPVELFKPWYAHGIAESIMRTANLSVPLKIYEIGGGSGTCAKGIMDYIMLNAPEKVYNGMTYTCVEISPSLAKKQLETVGEVRSHLSKFKVECRDAAEKSGWGTVEQQPCWVIMLEVLDNLPHDLVYSENQVSQWMEVWVEKQNDSEALCELYKPLQDSLIMRCIEIMDMDNDHKTRGSGSYSAARNLWSKLFPRSRRCWLPTGCLKLLETLHGALPKMSLIASDFSYLPDVKIPGERAPLVSTKMETLHHVMIPSPLSIITTFMLKWPPDFFYNGAEVRNNCPHLDPYLPDCIGDISCEQKDGTSSDHASYLDAKGDADIFFPTDFWFLERMDHYCSGWRQSDNEKSLKRGKKRRTITLDTSSFMEEFGLPTKTRTKDGYNPLLDDFKNTKFYLSVPTHNTK